MWTECKGEYYSTFVLGSPTPNNGIVVKTRDFETVEFVNVIPYNENGSAEAISHIFDGQLFVACRQQWTLPYMLLMKYDIDKGEWKKPYRIEDANSRPNMFTYIRTPFSLAFAISNNKLKMIRHIITQNT